jgi:hypothetical protein
MSNYVDPYNTTEASKEEGLPWDEAVIDMATDVVRNMEPTVNETEEEMGDDEGIKIHTDIPIPQNAGVGRKPRYPLLKMNVGDCFFVESGRTEEGRREERTLRQTVSRYHRRMKEQGTRWVVVRQDDNSIGVWRKS